MIFELSELLILFVFILGTIAGSFLNVVALRFNTGNSFLKGRSSCFSCGSTLTWKDLIPVLSYVALRGKCRSCKSKISKQYPFVEVATGLLFTLCFMAVADTSFSGIIQIGLLWALVSISVMISVYDIRHTIIPDMFNLLFIVTAFSYAVFFAESLFLHILAGGILFSFFGGLWLISEGRWMGLGDAKLSFGIGLWLGVLQGIHGVMLGFWIGAVFALLLMGYSFVQKKLTSRFSLRRFATGITMKSEVPFGPFLLLGAFLAYFFQPTFFSALMYF